MIVFVSWIEFLEFSKLSSLCGVIAEHSLSDMSMSISFDSFFIQRRLSYILILLSLCLVERQGHNQPYPNVLETIGSCLIQLTNIDEIG